jgi:ABC-type polysaccharide/polyol phosphate export permease
VFYLMFSILGMRDFAIRGDFLLYLMSGIFLFLTHNKAMSAVMGAEGPTSAMMKHAPMNTAIAIGASALSSLYTSVLAMVTLLLVYHIAVTPIWMPNPMAAFGMFMLSWASGCAIGLVFMAVKPWAPGFVQLFTRFYMRANMIASGKMFLANTLPAHLLVMFDWNPLFHTIDQARGFAFLNYFPHNSTMSYPIKVTIVLAMLGLMGEFFTRKHVSLSWTAGK